MPHLKPTQVDDVDIVGFNGPPLVECGRALPVVRRRSDGMHCVLDLARAGGALAWHDADEADDFVKAKRWTRFGEPLHLPSSCTGQSNGSLSCQPMIVYATLPFLDTAGQVVWPVQFQGHGLTWLDLEGIGEIRAACAPDATVHALLDDWAMGLKRRFDAMHQSGSEPASLKRVADFMLVAARSRPLRWQAYLRFAAFQEPERLQRTFAAFVRPEFPDATWQGYLDEIHSLLEVLRHVPVQAPQRAPAASMVSTRSKLHGIARRLPIDPRRAA
ncbi:MAG: hypothetical protein ACYC61_29935 [Isosphaeraceae bacterium]